MLPTSKNDNPLIHPKSLPRYYWDPGHMCDSSLKLGEVEQNPLPVGITDLVSASLGSEPPLAKLVGTSIGLKVRV